MRRSAKGTGVQPTFPTKPTVIAPEKLRTDGWIGGGVWIKMYADVACDGCSAECHYLYEVGRFGRVRSVSNSSKAGVMLCEDCLAALLEGITGFGWVAQLTHWRTFSAATRKVPRVNNRKDR